MSRLTYCIAALMVCSCAGGLDNDGQTVRRGQAGLSIKLGSGSSSNSKVKEVNVTVARVTAHSSTAGWVEIFNRGPLTINLLQLADRAVDLGFAELPPGKITQIRLFLVEGGVQNVVLLTGETVALKVPSGVQSGIKIKGSFELNECSVTRVRLDFDGDRSCDRDQTDGKWILRPVIKIKESSKRDDQCSDDSDGDDSDGGSSGRGRGRGRGENCGGGSGGGNGNDDDDSTGGGSGGGNDDDDDSTGGGNGSDSDGGTVIDETVDRTPGTPCSLGSQCLSGVCSNSVCEAGAQGTPCSMNSHCDSELCGTDGTCTVPVDVTPQPTGSPCSVGAQCVSGICSNSVCQAGIQNQSCGTDSDCAAGFACAANVCEPILN